MIHKYKLGDYNIVLDVNSGGVHVVDELTYDMLDNVAPPFAPECPEEVVTKLSRFLRSGRSPFLLCGNSGGISGRHSLFAGRFMKSMPTSLWLLPFKAMCLNIRPRLQSALQVLLRLYRRFRRGQKADVL